MTSMTDETLLKQWKKAIKYAVIKAKNMGHKVSIGGLSAGGTLSTYYAINYAQDIQGALFLFAAALELGDFFEAFITEDNILVETSEKIWDEFQSKKRGYFVGNRPHAYGWVPAKGAERLSELILEIEEKYPSKSQRYNDIKQPVFAVHCEFDKTANIGKIE